MIAVATSDTERQKVYDMLNLTYQDDLLRRFSRMTDAPYQHVTYPPKTLAKLAKNGFA